MIIPICRLSIFGDFRMLEPTSSNVVTWTQALQGAGYEMLPNVIQPTEPVLLPTGPQIPPQFIQFSESNKRETKQLLRLTNQRIDAECEIIDSESWQEVLKGIFDCLLKLIRVGSGFAQDTKGTRLAYYVDLMIKEPTPRAFQEFYCNNNFGLSFGDSGMTDCGEWTHRFNQNRPLMTALGEELCNLILLMESNVFRKVSPDTLKTEEYQGLRVSADLNTLGENNTPRFSINDMDVFCHAAMESHISILQSIVEMLK